MTTDSNSQRTLGAVMSAETGFEDDTNSTPLRISGFISVILALISGFSIVATPVVALSIAAIGFGIFALRKSDSQAVPVGTTAARIGILLAVLFGTWGVGRRVFRTHTLGSQAEYFAREFVQLVSQGDELYAKELQKSHINRYLKTMSLQERYELEQEKLRQRMEESREDPSLQMSEMQAQEDEAASLDFLKKFPPDHPWILDRPVRVYVRWGRQKADVVLASDDSEKPTRVSLTLELLVHRENGNGEWYVELCQPYRERLVAESIL